MSQIYLMEDIQEKCKRIWYQFFITSDILQLNMIVLQLLSDNCQALCSSRLTVGFGLSHKSAQTHLTLVQIPSSLSFPKSTSQFLLPHCYFNVAQEEAQQISVFFSNLYRIFCLFIIFWLSYFRLPHFWEVSQLLVLYVSLTNYQILTVWTAQYTWYCKMGG